MGLHELQSVLPSLERVRRPQRMGGGLVGGWQSSGAQLAGLSGTQTFFLAGGALRRVEFLADTQALADGGAAAFDSLLAWGRGRYGAERVSQDASSRYAAWSDADTDVYVRLLAPPRAGLQLVIGQRPPRDDSNL
ncbi:hypothetical protein GT347_20480 [Xylophilus rhododendri]|uniref:Uncharacterized protein n=2 Tax=Xylophilus rhododendri TaxID=2697032 RepID=A0A857JCB6_9BURK|nr:hypothetical protein GT347_20480 [Xylophilus rhododendri]